MKYSKNLYVHIIYILYISYKIHKYEEDEGSQSGRGFSEATDSFFSTRGGFRGGGYTIGIESVEDDGIISVKLRGIFSDLVVRRGIGKISLFCSTFSRVRYHILHCANFTLAQISPDNVFETMFTCSSINT